MIFKTTHLIFNMLATVILFLYAYKHQGSRNKYIPIVKWMLVTLAHKKKFSEWSRSPTGNIYGNTYEVVHALI